MKIYQAVRIIWLVFLFIASSSCQVLPSMDDGFPMETSTIFSSHTHSMAATGASPSIPETAINSTATPDLRRNPIDWQDWPIAPDRVSSHMQEIYEQGIFSGNNPQAFSKVGDCQNITEVFLGLFDSGQYTLDPSSSGMQMTIDFYRGSFGRDSQAVRGGFNAASVLSPLWADLEECNPGETPLDCELRLHRPGIVIISLETWFPGRTPETYSAYLRQIIEKVVAAGAVPLLSTKADNTEGDDSINLAIASLAYEYDLPMWNFWRAVQPLPDHGIDWTRDPGGFHITYEAWSVRSFSALWALDSLRRLLNSSGSATSSAATPTTEARIASPPVVAGLPPAEGFLASLAEYSGGSYSESGLFFVALPGGQVKSLTQPGYRLQAISSEGDQYLVSQDHSLYLAIPGESRIMTLSGDFYPGADRGALWHGNGDRIVFMENGDGETAIISTDPDGSDRSQLTSADQHPLDLYAVDTSGQIYWEGSSCYNDVCLSSGTQWITAEGEEAGAFPGAAIISASPSTDRIAYVSQVEGEYSLFITGSDHVSSTLIHTTDHIITDVSWSPDGDRIAIIETVQSAYSGRQIEQHYLIVSLPDGQIQEIELPDQSMSDLVWSPDNAQLWLIGTQPLENKSRMNFISYDLATGSTSTPIYLDGYWGGAYAFIRHVGFISHP